MWDVLPDDDGHIGKHQSKLDNSTQTKSFQSFDVRMKIGSNVIQILNCLKFYFNPYIQHLNTSAYFTINWVATIIVAPFWHSTHMSIYF